MVKNGLIDVNCMLKKDRYKRYDGIRVLENP